jgi:fido (protein-threonine AMPylation protein)
MGLELDYIDGQTPIDEDEIEGLIISSIATRGELDEFEQQNIEQTVQWTLMRNFKQLKHRLVSIHCFPNGNGRHSRLIADIIIEKIYKRPVFTWGAGNISNEGDIRTAYIKAIKAADNGDYSLLLDFARS